MWNIGVFESHPLFSIGKGVFSRCLSPPSKGLWRKNVPRGTSATLKMFHVEHRGLREPSAILHRQRSFLALLVSTLKGPLAEKCSTWNIGHAQNVPRGTSGSSRAIRYSAKVRGSRAPVSQHPQRVGGEYTMYEERH